MAVAARRRLDHGPDVMLATAAEPCLHKLVAVFAHLEPSGSLIMAYGKRKVEDTVGTHILRDKADDLLGISIVPAVDMHEPCRMVHIDGTAQTSGDRHIRTGVAAAGSKLQRLCDIVREIYGDIIGVGYVDSGYGTDLLSA